MPAVKKGVPPPGERRVLIAELPEWAQLPFDGYECVPCSHTYSGRLSWMPRCHQSGRAPAGASMQSMPCAMRRY